MDIFIGTTLEMTEISFFFLRKLHQHLHGQGYIPGLHFLFCRSMRTREMMGIVVMFHEHGLIVSQSILFAEQSPDAVSVIRIAAVKLNLFEFGKLLD
jgi:hypothetical protein